MWGLKRGVRVELLSGIDDARGFKPQHHKQIMLIYKHMCTCVWMFMCCKMCVHACGGLRSIYYVILQVQSHWFCFRNSISYWPWTCWFNWQPVPVTCQPPSLQHQDCKQVSPTVLLGFWGQILCLHSRDSIGWDSYLGLIYTISICQSKK